MNTKTRKNNNNIKNSKFKKSTKTYNTVCMFLEMLHTIKLAHWNTHIFSIHKATDELYGELNSNIDKFVEVLLGKTAVRVAIGSMTLEIVDVHNKFSLITSIEKYKTFLMNLSGVFSGKKNDDLMSIRDDIMANMNQFLYLLTLQ
jgi:DNA-binding ferritin-like protein